MDESIIRQMSNLVSEMTDVARDFESVMKSAKENQPTLRDQFAMAALASGRIRMPYENARPDGGPSPEMQTVLEVYRLADAMIEARKPKA
jgi:hypothetical protein